MISRFRSAGLHRALSWDNPNGVRWVKICFEGEPVWVNAFDVDEAYKTDDQMLDFAEYDMWKVLP